MGEELIHNYLKDILRHIAEIEQTQKDAKDLKGFENNFYFKRTSERNFLIIGEIIKKLSTLSPETFEYQKQRKYNWTEKFFSACVRYS